MIPFENVQKGVAAYLDNEVMPAFRDEGWKRVAAGAAISLVINRSSNYIPILQQNKVVSALGLIDENGSVDIEGLVPVVKQQLEKEPLSIDVPMLGKLTFRPDDVEKLYDYIRAIR